MGGAKEDELYVVPTADGSGAWSVSGVFYRDTVYFSEWSWTLDGALLLSRSSSRDTVSEFQCLTAPDRSQTVALKRTLKVDAEGFSDRWTATNFTAEPQTVQLRLTATPRFKDLFAGRLEADAEVTIESARLSSDAWRFMRRADDSVLHSATINCDRPLPDDWSWTLRVPPHETASLEIRTEIQSSDHRPSDLPTLPSYEDWRASFRDLYCKGRAVGQAVDDLRALLLRTEFGPYPAAGLPIFINFFGRDALIAGLMVLERRPDLLRSVLAFLAANQGKTLDPFREEEPGKILHEIRRGELSRTNRIPFGRYYGSVDSTPLFLVAAGEYLAVQDEPAFASTLRPAVEAATDWLTDHLTGSNGLATFKASGSGLTIQSWKDSANSMVDHRGQPACQPLAVAEVQGYAYAALLAAARLLPERSASLTERARALRATFHQMFWLADLSTYAMALDADLQPLRVLSSDPGHLLWTGIVPDEVAPTLVKTLMSEALWSGWGLRTLGSNEVAFNPVSYHNGSVWPHDTALFAMGLARYGFKEELRQVASAMLDLAEAAPGRHMPELISGYDRTEHDVPVPYTHANAPQAWAAAAVIRMASYLVPQIADHQ